jgi:hypothetical protein
VASSNCIPGDVNENIALYVLAGDSEAALEVVLKVGAVHFHHYNISGTLVLYYFLTSLSFLDTTLKLRSVDIPS